MTEYDHNSYKYPQYYSPDNVTIKTQLSQLNHFLQKLCEKTKNLDINKISIDEEKLIEICVRTDQRKLHYKMYHGVVLMNECKEAAVLAYWFVRLKPLTYDMGDGVYATSHLNELFALFLITSIIHYVRGENGKSGNFTENRLLVDLFYTLKFRPIMFDDLTLMVDSLAHAS